MNEELIYFRVHEEGFSVQIISLASPILKTKRSFLKLRQFASLVWEIVIIIQATTPISHSTKVSWF